MCRLINLARRALALYAVRCLEIQLHDQTDALRHVTHVDTYRRVHSARTATQRDLLVARQHYISLLKPGHCPTWRLA